MKVSVEQSGRASASQLDMETAVSGVAPQGGMALHFSRYPSPTPRVLEVEVELFPPNDGAAATVLVLEQPGTTDATIVDATSPRRRAGRQRRAGWHARARCVPDVGRRPRGGARPERPAVAPRRQLHPSWPLRLPRRRRRRRRPLRRRGAQGRGQRRRHRRQVPRQLAAARAPPSPDDIATSASATPPPPTAPPAASPGGRRRMRVRRHHRQARRGAPLAGQASPLCDLLVRRGARPAEDDSTTEYIVPAAADGAYAVSIADRAPGTATTCGTLLRESGADGAGEPLPASVSVAGTAGGGGGALTTLEPVTDGAVTEWTEDCGGGAVCSHAIVANQTHTFALDAVPGRQVLEVEVVTDGTEPGWLSLAIAPEGNRSAGNCLIDSSFAAPPEAAPPDWPLGGKYRLWRARARAAPLGSHRACERRDAGLRRVRALPQVAALG